MNRADAVAMIRAHHADIAPGQTYEVDFLRPEDALGVARLVYRVYGDKYPIDDYYSPERIAAANAAGDIITFVARTPSGDVIGKTGLWRTSSPNPHLYEFGHMVILPEYRGGGISADLTAQVRACLETRAEIHGFFGEAVTTHLVTQKFARLCGAVPCAMELSLMPDGAFAGEKAGDIRVSCLMMAAVLRDIRRPLCLPASDRPTLEPIVTALGADRALSWSMGTAPVASASVLTVQRFDSAGVIRCHVETIGTDLAARLAALGDPPVALVEVFLAADTLAAPWAVATLRDQGYCLTGLAPLWLGNDAIVMLKLAAPPDFEVMRFLDEEGRALCDWVRAEYHQTHH